MAGGAIAVLILAVLPRRVSGKFSIRQVPNMTSSRTEQLVSSYLESQWAALGSKYALEVKMVHGGPAWVSRTDHPNYVARGVIEASRRWRYARFTHRLPRRAQ